MKNLDEKKVLEYTDEATFLTEEVEFTAEHYYLAKYIHESINESRSPLMVYHDKKSLFFCVNLTDRSDRVALETSESLYRVIIEKI